jgi:hypothetical protein
LTVNNADTESHDTDYLSVSDVARELDARPQDVSQLFYRRLLRDDSCPVIAGRRAIPRTLLPEIARTLKRAGRPVNLSALENA